MTARDDERAAAIEAALKSLWAPTAGDRFTRAEFLTAAAELDVDATTAGAAYDEHIARRARPPAALARPASTRLLVEGGGTDRLVIEEPARGPEVETSTGLVVTASILAALLLGIVELPWPFAIFFSPLALGAGWGAFRAYRAMFGRLRLTLTPEGGRLETGPPGFSRSFPLQIEQLRCRIDQDGAAVLAHGVRDHDLGTRPPDEQAYLVSLVHDWLSRYA